MPQGLTKIGNLLPKTGNMQSETIGQQKKSTEKQKTLSSISQTEMDGSKPAQTGQSGGSRGLEKTTERMVAMTPQGGAQDLPQHMKQWEYMYHEPPPATAEELDYLEDAWNQTLVPCDRKAAMVMLDETLALYGAPDNWDSVAKFYLEAVDDVPEDLLAKALKHIRMNLKWFPKPCEIRTPIAEDMEKRRRIMARISYMRLGLNHFG